MKSPSPQPESPTFNINNFSEAAAEHRKLYTSKAPEAGKKRIDFCERIAEGALDKWREADPKLKLSLKGDLVGLKIDIGEEGTSGIHAHIPYHLLKLETLKKLSSHVYDQNGVYTGQAENTQIYGENSEHNPELQKIIIDGYNSPEPNKLKISKEEYESMLTLSEESLGLMSENLYQSDSYHPFDRNFLAHQFFYLPELVAKQVRRGYPITPETLDYVFSDKMEFTLERTIKSRIMSILRFVSFIQIENEASSFKQSRHSPHISFNLNNEAKRIHTLQKSTLGENYLIQAGKCIQYILQRFSVKQLEEMGITVCTTAYGGGDKMFAFWSQGEYASVLLRPGTNIDEKFVKDFEANSEQQVLARADFETLDTNMRLAFTAENLFNNTLNIRRLSKNSNDYDPNNLASKETISENSTILLTIFARELPAAQMHEFAKVFENFKNNVISPQDFAIFLTKIMEVFRGKVWVKPQVLLEQHLQKPKKVVVKFGKDYNQSFPKEHLRSDANERSEPFSPLLRNLPEQDVSFAVSMTKDAIPFAQCARMMRILGLEPSNTISCLVGSSKMQGDKNQAVAQTVSQAVYDVSKTIKANVGMPGTQPGYAAQLLQPVLPNRGKENEPDYFSIIPGKNVPFTGNPYFDETDKKHSYAAVPNKSFVTPFDGGFGKHPDEVRHHNLIQESIYAAMSDGFKRVTLVANAGFGAITEMVMALQNNSPILFVADSGRLATFVSKILEKNPSNSETFLNLSNLDILKAKLAEILPELDETNQLELQKSLENEKYLNELATFFAVASKKPNLISSCESTNLEKLMLELFNS